MRQYLAGNLLFIGFVGIVVNGLHLTSMIKRSYLANEIEYHCIKTFRSRKHVSIQTQTHLVCTQMNVLLLRRRKLPYSTAQKVIDPTSSNLFFLPAALMGNLQITYE